MNTTAYGGIKPEEIKELHAMGFKLVPICGDGVTPTIVWTNVYENGWKKDELDNIEFPIVATCFGKTQLRDEHNRDLYLNCLDIDSEEVFTKLAIIVDRNGNDQYFISELRKHTFVTKTRKKFGYHIYWLSHNPNVAIHVNQCKSNHEFEIRRFARIDSTNLGRKRWYVFGRCTS